jgi:hypothetical protein
MLSLKRLARIITAIFIICALPMTSLATKACPPPPCYTDATLSTFDKAKCSLHSDWIATGTVKVIAHHYKGMPLNKDFLSFVFNSQTWEKGVELATDTILFQVGWCKNPAFPIGAKHVRIYGTVVKSADSVPEYRFWKIEKLQ